MKACEVPGCLRPVDRGRRMCNTHRSRLRKGLPMTDESRVQTRLAVDRLMAQIQSGIWPSGCVEWPGARSPQGYGLTKRNGQNLASRAVWLAVFGPIAEGLCVLHRCDNPPCVNPGHLFLGTRADNTADMMTKGRHVPRIGSDNGRTKLTDAQVSEIRAAVAAGESRTSVAARYGVHPAHVGRVCSGFRRAVA